VLWAARFNICCLISLYFNKKHMEFFSIGRRVGVTFFTPTRDS
jgi:hypothetical protein